MKRRHVLLSVAAAATAAALAACGQDKPAYKSIDISGVDYAKGFRLTDQHGKVRTLEDFRGKVVVVFFGFTQCPDVCPTSMTELAEARRLLGPDGDKVQGVFITIDPERDTADVLKAYVDNFDPSFVALRGTPEETAKVAQDFKVYYKKVDGKTPGSYTMDHTAASFVIDPQGRPRLYTRYGTGPQPLADDIRLLLREGA